MLARRWRKGVPVHCWWECKLVQSLWKTVWSLLKKLKIELAYDLAIPLWGIYSKKLKMGKRKKMSSVFPTLPFPVRPEMETAEPQGASRLPASSWGMRLWLVFGSTCFSPFGPLHTCFQRHRPHRLSQHCLGPGHTTVSPRTGL